MALQIDHVFNGVLVPGAVVRVLFTNGGKRAGKWESQLGVFANATAEDPYFTFNHVVSYVANVHPFVEVYTDVKTNVFVNAVDC